jgi:hypothetical protein
VYGFVQRYADEMVLHGVRGCTSYRKGDRPQIGRQGKLLDEERLGPEYYLNTRQIQAHKGMVSVPLIPRRDGPSQGETIEPSRLCIGVVNIGFEETPLAQTLCVLSRRTRSSLGSTPPRSHCSPERGTVTSKTMRYAYPQANAVCC